MAFKSQHQKSKSSSRRGSSAEIVVSQSYKPSTDSEELSVRISSGLMSMIGLSIGGKADVLFDDESSMWMVKACVDGGFTVSGKQDAPTGLIRYTLKQGHARLTENRADLPVKCECEDGSIELGTDHVIFALKR